MNYLRWGISGIVSVAVPFAAFYDPYDLWNCIMAGMAGGSLFLITLLIARREQLRAGTERAIVTAAAIFFIGGMGAHTYEMYQMTHYQCSTLLQIRTKIGAGIILTDKIHESMLPVLKDFHAQNGHEHRSIVELFRARYAHAIADGSFNQYPRNPDQWETMDAVTLVRFSGDSLVRYHCIDTIALGRDPKFTNTNGSIGRLEFTAQLTSRGVAYERIN